MSTFTLAFGAFAYVSFSTLERVRVGGPVYEQISSGKELIADILPPPAYIIEAYLLSLQLSTEKERGAIGAATLRSKALKDEYEALMTPETKAAYEEARKRAEAEDDEERR